MPVSWLDRALEAEAQLESAREENADLKNRLRGILEVEPESASRALSWIGRAEQAEKLLIEIVNWFAASPANERLLPSGLADRVRAQLVSVQILKRDQEAFGEKPADEQWWERWRDDEGRSWLGTSDRPT